MSLWDTLLIPADKLQQLRTDTAAPLPPAPRTLGFSRARSVRLTVRLQKFSLPRYCASSPTRRTADAASAKAA